MQRLVQNEDFFDMNQSVDSSELFLNTWLEGPQGSDVLRALGQELVEIDHILYGMHMLQLGLAGLVSWRSSLHFPCSWVVGSAIKNKKTTFDASFIELPLASNSIDCILAPFAIEICAQKKLLLDEIDRVLKPMGHVIFLGVNPWSLWGLALKMSGNRQLIKPCSSLYLQHHMTARGYLQRVLNNCYFIPPLCFFSPHTEEKWLHRLEFLNEMGKMLWPCPAGFYCLVMQKYSACITPLVNQALVT